MPEGDTILRAARTLAKALEGKQVVKVHASVATTPPLASLEGRKVSAVTAHGKNLLVTFDDGRVLHTHMMMLGSWHLYRPGERWRKPAHRARLSMTVGVGEDAFVAVCFSAPVVRLLAAGAAPRDPRLTRLGPDVLADDFDPRAALARLRALSETPLGEALLVQTAVAGIGNIYKSEALFARRVDPFARVGDLSDDLLLDVLREAQRLMRHNVAPGSATRTTSERPERGGRHAVYRRSGAPCVVCGSAVAMRRQGAQRRSTYYCPQCQQMGAVPSKTTPPRPVTPPRSALPPPETNAPRAPRYARPR